jgi:hypothetical protein
MTDSIVNTLVSFLFDAEEKHWNKQVHKLIEHHDQVMSRTGDETRWGFLYAGNAYRHPDSPFRGNTLRGLHLSLVPEMKALLADRALFIKDKTDIRQALTQVVGPFCDNNAELRNALPECLVPALPSLVSIPRTEKAENMLEPGSHAHSMFVKNVEKMEAYSATRLIY